MDDEADIRVPRAETGVPLTADRRDSRIYAAIAHQLDVAEECMLFAGIGRSAQRMLLERFPRMTRKHANRLQVAVQMRWHQERGGSGGGGDRGARKALHRARLEDLYRRALEAKTCMARMIGGGVQEFEYVDEPDLKAAAVVLQMLGKLDGLDVPELSSGEKTPEESKAAAREVFAQMYGLNALPSGE